MKIFYNSRLFLQGLLLSSFLFFNCLQGFAQQGINYKALIKDASGNVVANDLVEVQFQILQGTAMTNVYQETHNPTTDGNGIVNVTIGEGTTKDVFTDIDWGVDDHFLNVQVNTGGGLVDMGSTQFTAVPYAKHAEKAANAATKIDDLIDAKSDDAGTSVFLGKNAGLSDDGTDNKNVALGFEALSSNTAAENNTALGYAALRENTTGRSNTANGTNALQYNTTGWYNTASGWQALISNTTGESNTSSGSGALHDNTIGSFNTAFGYAALFSNSVGNNNTAIGNQAGINNTGSGNVFIGSFSGSSEFGSDKLYIANSGTADPLVYGQFDKSLLAFHGNVGIDTKNPSTKLHIAGGTDASLAGGSGFMILGNESGFNLVIDNDEMMARENGAISSLYFQRDGGDVRVGGSVVHTSDRRLKRDVEVLPYGLNEILQLQPKAYYWKKREQDSKSFGLIAQEVQPIINELVSVNDPDSQMLSINYTELIPVLINAIQEQQEIIEGLKAMNDRQDKAIQSVTAELRELGAKKEIISGSPH